MTLSQAKELKIGEPVVYKFQNREYATGEFVQLLNDKEILVSDKVFQDTTIVKLSHVKKWSDA